MARIIISIACFVLAVAISGCQECASSDSAVEIEHSSIETVEANKESNTVNTTITSDKDRPTVIVYYFHRTMRCPGCLEIEAKAQQVIENSFANQITDEKLMWIPFNLDGPGGEEFEKEFDVSVSTLLLAKTKDGNFIKHKKLEKVWDLIGDPLEFDNYVKSELTLFLNE